MIRRLGCCAVRWILLTAAWAMPGAAASITVPSGQCASIGRAMATAKAGDTVWLEKGTFREHVFIESKVVIISRVLHGAIIDGGGRHSVVTLGGNASISGCGIRNGTIGVFVKGMNNAITRCRIVNNWETGIVCVGHLPRIEDNIIAFNRASGIQGWKLRATVYPAVRHNTIAFNGNHGIAVGGNSDIRIEDCIICFNQQFAIKVSQDEPRIRLFGNVLYGNSRADASLPSDNYSFDPAFADAARLDFRLREISPCKERSANGEDAGVRFIY